MRDITTPLEVLVAARELISDEDHWVKGAWAINNRTNLPIDAESPSATCFCGQGAIRRVVFDRVDPFHQRRLLNRAVGTIDDILSTLFAAPVEPADDYSLLDEEDERRAGLPDFNDHTKTTHSDVLHVFDLGIARYRRLESHAS